MKNIAALALTTVATIAAAQVYVNPYVKQDGTIVQGHLRSSPNSTDLDNYSTRGNVNPYTGQAGTRTPRFEQPAWDAPRQYQLPPANNSGTQCEYTTTGRYVCR